MNFKARINANGMGKVELGGIDISNIIRGCSISAQVGSATKVELDMIGEIEFEGEVDILIRDSIGTKIALKDYLK